MDEPNLNFQLGMMIPPMGYGVMLFLDGGLGIHLGGGLEAGFMGIVLLTASAVLWIEGAHWASAGYLVMLGDAILLVFPQNGIGNPLAIAGFFGCLIIGFLLVIYDAILRVERRRDTNPRPT